MFEHNILESIILVVVSLLGLFMKRRFDAKDAKDVEIKELLAKIEESKENDILEWKEEVHDSLCTIKVNTQKIADELHDKVPYEHCSGRLDKLDERIRAVGG